MSVKQALSDPVEAALNLLSDTVPDGSALPESEYAELQSLIAHIIFKYELDYCITPEQRRGLAMIYQSLGLKNDDIVGWVDKCVDPERGPDSTPPFDFIIIMKFARVVPRLIFALRRMQ